MSQFWFHNEWQQKEDNRFFAIVCQFNVFLQQAPFEKRLLSLLIGVSTSNIFHHLQQ